jgi:pimeloyl-ACP methyl ester carboxylesterase
MLLTLLVLPSVSSAQGPKRDPDNNNTVNPASTIHKLLKTLDRVGAAHEGVATELARLRASFGIVFVPGILGSTLESASKGKLWGFGIPAHGAQDALRLDPALIDETAPSDVTTGLALSLGPVPLYGEAIRLLRQSAGKLGIPDKRVVACGYDWRRDIRWGARELDKCITTNEDLRDATALIIVAHSMGGLVTWKWHQDYARDGWSGDKRVIALAVLGSPLEGSCEMLRMIQVGYVQPTTNTMYRDDQYWKRWWSKIEEMKDRFVNLVTSQFSQDLRPVILTWPGAFELMPRPARTITGDDDHLCARLPEDPGDPDNPRVLAPFDRRFWNSPLGEDLLGRYTPPQDFDAVLNKAADFRMHFSATTLSTLTYLFVTKVWVTPTMTRLTGDYRLAAGDWNNKDGDGRVPTSSAQPGEVVAAQTEYVYSVHGNLPEDEVFHDKFFGDRLPRVLAGYVASNILQMFGSHDEFLKAYAAGGGLLVNPEDFRVSFERVKSPYIIYPLTREAVTSADDFNLALCDGRIACASKYKNATLAAARARTNTAKAAAFTAVIIKSPRGSPDETRALARRGLAMASDMNWAAAINDLREAVPRLEHMRAAAGGREKPNERDLRVNATAMLARALAIRGYCDEAREPMRKAAKEGQPHAMRDLGASCYDHGTGKYVVLNR